MRTTHVARSVALAAEALRPYKTLITHDDEDFVDVLTDLMHLAGQRGVDFDKALRYAKGHYNAEVAP